MSWKSARLFLRADHIPEEHFQNAWSAFRIQFNKEFFWLKDQLQESEFYSQNFEDWAESSYTRTEGRNRRYCHIAFEYFYYLHRFRAGDSWEHDYENYNRIPLSYITEGDPELPEIEGLVQEARELERIVEMQERVVQDLERQKLIYSKPPEHLTIGVLGFSILGFFGVFVPLLFEPSKTLTLALFAIGVSTAGLALTNYVFPAPSRLRKK